MTEEQFAALLHLIDAYSRRPMPPLDYVAHGGEREEARELARKVFLGERHG